MTYINRAFTQEPAQQTLLAIILLLIIFLTTTDYPTFTQKFGLTQHHARNYASIFSGPS